MACLKRLLPAGYSGYSQIPAQSRSRSLPWWAKPLPAPGALLQTFINPFVLHMPGFEVGMCIFSIYIYIIFPFKPSHPLSAGCPSACPWLRGLRGARQVPGLGWLCQHSGRDGRGPHCHHDWGQAWNWGRICPVCLLPSPRLGLDSSTREILSAKGHCLNQHLNDIPNLFLKFINPFVFSSSKTLSQDIM